MKALARPQPAAAAPVVALAQARIEKALGRRARYRYVRPQVQRLDRRRQQGWKIVSPNCSRVIDASGGLIDIAWLLQGPDGRWTLHARDHAQARWLPLLQGQTLDAALDRLCEDPLKEYWL